MSTPNRGFNSSYFIILLVLLYSIYSELYWLTTIAAIILIVRFILSRASTPAQTAENVSVETPPNPTAIRSPQPKRQAEAPTKEGTAKAALQALKQLDLMENVNELPALKDHYEYLLNDLYPTLQLEANKVVYADKVKQSVDGYLKLTKKELLSPIQTKCLEDPSDTAALKEYYCDRIYAAINQQLTTILAAIESSELEKNGGIKHLLELTDRAKQELRQCGMTDKNIAYLNFIAEKREMLYTMRLS